MQYILKTWKEVTEKLSSDKNLQRAIIYNGYKEPLIIYFDTILQSYVIEIAF